MTRTPDNDLARLSDGELLVRLCGTNGPTLSLLHLLWRDADVLYVWSSGHYLARRRGGQLQRVRTL